LDRRTVELRGLAGTNGVAIDNIALAPNTHYRERILQGATLFTGAVEFATPGNGQQITLPAGGIGPSNARDSDHDGLPDDAELIMGTDPSNPDSDSDGVTDSAEVRQGTDPLDGLPARTGLIATADTPGTALDLCAFNDVVVVADADAGIT